jgi:hypothetical protein
MFNFGDFQNEVYAEAVRDKVKTLRCNASERGA